MTIKLESIKADLKRENEGDWVDIPDLPGVRLRVRSHNYGPYKIALSKSLQRLVRRHGREQIPDDVALMAGGSVYADHILLDWEGFDEPYTPETARAVLMNPAYRELQAHVRYAAAEIAKIEAQFVEDASGN